MEISALECYNEQLYDMLGPPASERAGPARWDTGTGLAPAAAFARRRGGGQSSGGDRLPGNGGSNGGGSGSGLHEGAGEPFQPGVAAGVAGSAAAARGADLAIWEDAEGLAAVRGLTVVPARTEADALAALEEARVWKT